MELISKEAAAGKAKHAAQVYGDRGAASEGRHARDWQCMKLAALDIDEALRAIPAQSPAVKVKPLVWEHGHKFAGQPCSYADTEFGAWMLVAYVGRDGRWAHTDPNGQDSEEDWITREECQAAAQADYESRILSALEVTND